MVATPIPDGSIVKVRTAVKDGPQYSLNVGYFACAYFAGASGALSTQEMADALEPSWAGQYKIGLSVLTEWWGLGVTLLTDPATPEAVNFGSRGVGDDVAFVVPNQCAPLITLRTALAGRRWRGRKYLPAPGQTQVLADMSTLSAAGLIWTAGCGDLWAVGNNFSVGAATITYTPVIWHRPPPPPDPGWEPTVIVDRTIRAKLATQRRRAEINRADVDPFIVT